MSEQQTNYSQKVKTIFRTIKNEENPFVMMDRRPIENPNLSWKAKGILAYLLSRPDNWTVRLGDLIKRSTDGTHAVRQAIRELQAAGHVRRVEHRDPKTKRIVEYTLEVYELPFTSKPLTNFLQAENLQAENLTLNDTDCNDTELNNGVPPISEFPIDWQLAAGVSAVTPPDEKEAQIKDTANLIATGVGARSALYYSIAYAFMKARQIVIPESKVKGQRKAIKEMTESGVQPSHVSEAVQKLIDAGMTVIDLFSVTKTAIALANPVSGDGYNPQGMEIGF